MIRLVFITLLNFLGLAAINSQSPFFHHYSLADQLQGSEGIKIIYEDPLGPIWLGTDVGLYLFDGQQFQLYEKSDGTHSAVSAIYRDREQRLWVGYQDGSIYHLTQGQLVAWMPEEGIPAASVKALLGDDSGQLWIATYGEGLYYWNGQRLFNINEDDGLSSNEIYAMIVDVEGRVWCSTDSGINVCKAQGSDKQIRHLAKADGLPDEIVNTLLLDRDRGCWVGTHDAGVCYYDFASAKFFSLTPDWEEGVVSSLTQFEEKELWIGTEGNGLWRLRLDETDVLSNINANHLERLDRDNPNMGAKVFDIHKDVEGNLWIATNSKSINRANRQFELLSTDLPIIESVLHDEDNRLWVGTSEGLYSEIGNQNGKLKFKKWIDHPNILSLYEDPFGNIWAGSFGEGVFCLQPKSGKVIHLSKEEGLSNGSVLSMDGRGKYVWLATLGGVTEFEVEEDPFSGILPVAYNYNQESGLGTNFIYKVFVSSEGGVWFGTDGKGISVLRNGVISNYSKILVQETGRYQDSIVLKAVYGITEDANGHIWFSSAKDGLFKYDGRKFWPYHQSSGIRDLNITGIAADSKGGLLLTHSSGIDILDIHIGQSIYYDESIGLENFEPNINALSKDKEGNIWMAGQQELVKYTQLNEKLIRNPRIYLQQVAVGLVPIDLNISPEFHHRDNDFLFKYKGLWYTDPSRVQYRYRLHGNNSTWKSTGDQSVSFAGLVPGDYQLELMASIDENFVQPEEVRLAFSIAPPFWQRGWFIFLIVAFVITLLWGWQRWQKMRMAKINLLEKEKVVSQLNTLKSQISPHFLFNSFNTLAGIIEDQPKQAVEYVEQLSDFYRAILQYRDRELIQIEEELKLLKNYSYLLERRFGSNLQLDIALQPTADLIPPLSLQMLVENAIKHNVISRARPLHIRIYADDNFIYVENNKQPKLQAEPSTHFGLDSLRKRYDVLTNIPVLVTFDESHFKVNLPILRKHLSL